MTTQLSVGVVVAGRYQLLSEYEEGPAFTGFRAVDREAEVHVSLWRMRPELFASRAEADAFLGVVVEVRSLVHPNLRRLHEAGQVGEEVYVTGQLPTADSLEARLGTGVRASETEILRYAGALASALQTAHDAGYVHGLLVPGDVVHVAGQIKVGGVGLYSGMGRNQIRQLWSSHGRYLAPEVMGGGLISPAADIYSLGAILIELATGRVGSDSIVPLVGELKQINPPLAAVLAGAVADLPEARPHGARDLLARLGEIFVDDRVPTAPQPVQSPGLSFEAEEITEATSHEALPDFEAEKTVAEERPGIGLAQPEVPSFFQEQLRVPQDVAAPAQEASAPDVGPITEVLPDPGAADSAAITSDRLELISMREPDERSRRSTPILPVLERPGLEPRLKPVAGPVPTTAKNLGRYSRPPDNEPASRGSRVLVYVSVGLAAAALASSLVLIVRGNATEEERDSAAAHGTGGSGSDPSVALPVDAGSVAPAPPQGPCPDEMVHITGVGFCVDGYESPGKGRLPQAGITFDDAAAACSKRGARLCTSEEWERACRGEDGSSWPYGAAMRRNVCNVKSQQVDVAGARSECRGSEPIFDMSGNVAEWVADKQIRGGSAMDDSDGRCSLRRASPERQTAYSDVGFRCCAVASVGAD